MPDITISIKMRMGNIYYRRVNAAGETENASIAGANPGDTVVWECKKKYSIIVDFGSHSPFDQLRYIGTQKKPIREKVRENLGNHKEYPYKYSVTVFNSKRVKICSDDPVLVVPVGG